MIRACTNCELCLTRTNAVPGEGDENSKVMIVGEAPGKNEDEEGRPFVGRAGKVLTDILTELGIDRNQIFITNIVKCRPPKNRVPKNPEVEACSNYLVKQIESIQPEIIFALGQSSIKTLTGVAGKLGDIHGRQFSYKNFLVTATYHPAAVIYNRKLRSLLLNDLERIKEIIK
jgi:DNA polymerase